MIDAEIMEEVKQVAAADKTIAAAVEATAAALKQEFGDGVNFGKIAVQNVVQTGGTLHQKNTINL